MKASAGKIAFADDLRSPKPGAVPVATGGALPSKDGTAFSVWAPDASEIVVHIYDRQEHETGAYALPERRGGFWTGFVKGVGPGALYAFESKGGERPEQGFYFKEGRLLADPCAKALSRPFLWDYGLYMNDSNAFMPKSIVPDPKGSFDWQGVLRPSIRREGVILYETNVKGMTMLSDEVPPEHRGKFLGMCHKSVIDHLKALGITAVQLNPIAASMSEPALAEKGLSNYWGYNPVCFMAPDPRFAVDPFKAVDEFRTMVRELHRAGIAVILDVVYNHTAEGGFGGPVLSMKGLDARRYYAYCVDEHGAREYGKFLNASGCGNSFNCDE
ncbi:MAG: alpha-amylase family glycosyl hydrolase, partial [Succinivibrio sp.]